MRAWVVVLAACGRLRFDPVASPGDGAGAGDGLRDSSIVGSDTRPGIDANVVFVTPSALIPGTFGNLGTADTACQLYASQAGLPGTYVAWLSTSTTNAISRLAGARGWVRPDGLPFADLPSDIAAGKIFYPPSLDAQGMPVSASPATGTLGDGTISSANNCSDFTNVASSVLVGNDYATAGSFSDSNGVGCSNTLAIYCFGTSLSTPVSPSPTPGRRAFVSTPWASGTGLGGADAHCQADATAAGLTGTYAALLATSTASAASRFNGSGATWVRLDGVAIAPTASDLLTSGPTNAPLNETAQGNYVGFATAVVWNGAASPSVAGTTGTCTDWTSAATGKTGVTGAPEHASAQWFGVGAQACNLTAALYCLEM